MEYYSAFKKKETLSFATTQKNLESIRLSEISQISQILYGTAYMWNLIYRERCKRVQTFSYKMSRMKSEDLINNMVTVIDNTVSGNLNLLRKQNLNVITHKKRQICEEMDVSINSMRESFPYVYLYQITTLYT